MDYFTDFGKRLLLIVGIILALGLLAALYKLVYLPLAALEDQHFSDLVLLLWATFLVVWLAGLAWLLHWLLASARRVRQKRGRPVYARQMRDGKLAKVFVGWETPEGNFIPAPQPGFGSLATHVSLNQHQAYPPRWYAEQGEMLDTPEEAEPDLLPKPSSTWEEERAGWKPARFFSGMADRRTQALGDL